MGGLAKKTYNLDAARVLLAGTPELNIDERHALEAAFPDQQDYGIGATIYLLRTRLQAKKTRVANILGADARTLVRWMSALDMSVFCRVMIENSFAEIASRRPDLPIEVPDGLPFKTRLELKTKMALEAAMDSILNDPTKMYEADLESAVNSAKKLHEMYRLDSGQSTANISQVMHTDPEKRKKQEVDEEVELSDLGKATNELRVLMVKHQGA